MAAAHTEPAVTALSILWWALQLRTRRAMTTEYAFAISRHDKWVLPIPHGEERVFARLEP